MSDSNDSSIIPIADFHCGGDNPLVVIAGPCVIEDQETTMRIALELKDICQSLGLPLLFKASFDKANRSSLSSYRGPGLKEGLQILKSVSDELNLPVTTDFHESNQAEPVAQVCSVLQVPAFLSRQTDLLVAAAKTGKPVNVKKGQFMAPHEMEFVVDKLRSSGCQNVLLTERGTFFGYGKLVNDFTGLVAMRAMGVPVVFDATHSVQRPADPSGITLGNREMVAPLARAAVAVGVDAVFIETHFKPDQSPSDAANIFPLTEVAELLSSLSSIRESVRQSQKVHLQTPPS